MKRLLITGGAGFIGTNLVRYWIETHPDDTVVVYDALTYAGHRENLDDISGHPNFAFVEGDIQDEALVSNVMQQYQIDTILHLAAESHVDRSIDGPDVFLTTNILGTHALLKAAQRVWMSPNAVSQGYRFHHVSTDEVYGSLTFDAPAFTEASPYAPNSPYAASKAASDHLVRAYHKTYGLPTTISNCSNNFGPYQYPEKLIPLMIRHILHGKALPVYGQGLNVRDWISVADHCRALDKIIHHGRVGETYNIGGRAEWRNIDLVHLLCTLVDELLQSQPGLLAQFPHTPVARGGQAKDLISFVADRKGHDLRYAIDDRKAAQELNIHPEDDFKTALRATVHWYLRHQGWCDSVLDQLAKAG